MLVIFIIIIILCIACLLWPVSKSKPSGTIKKNDTNVEPLPENEASILGKSYFSLSQQPPIATSESQAVKAIEMPSIFESETNKETNPVEEKEALPTDPDNTTNPQPADADPDLDVMYEYEFEIDLPEEPDINWEEEAEELREVLGEEATFATGFNFEDLELAARAVKAENEIDEKRAGEILYNLETTDVFEQLVSGDTTREQRIKALIELHVKELNQLYHNTKADTHITYKDVDISYYL